MQEIKCKPEQFPFDAFHGRRLRGRAARPQPVERRRLRQPPADGRRRDRLPDAARLRQGRRDDGRPEGGPRDRRHRRTASASGASTCRTAANSTTRTTPTSSTGSRARAPRPRAWMAAKPEQPLALMGDWNVAPLDTDVWDIAVFEGTPTSAPPERDAFAALRGGRADRRRPPAPARGLHLLGLQAAALPAQRGHAHRLHPRLEAVRRPRLERRASTATSARATPRATTCRSSSTSTSTPRTTTTGR